MKSIKVLLESRIQIARFNIAPKIEKIKFYIDKFVSSIAVWITSLHSDKSLDTLRLNIRMWASGNIDYNDLSIGRFIVRLFPKIVHEESSIDTMRAKVIRPTKLYDVNNLKLGELNMSLGEFLYTEIN